MHPTFGLQRAPVRCAKTCARNANTEGTPWLSPTVIIIPRCIAVASAAAAVAVAIAIPSTVLIAAAPVATTVAVAAAAATAAVSVATAAVAVPIAAAAATVTVPTATAAVTIAAAAATVVVATAAIETSTTAATPTAVAARSRLFYSPAIDICSAEELKRASAQAAASAPVRKARRAQRLHDTPLRLSVARYRRQGCMCKSSGSHTVHLCNGLLSILHFLEVHEGCRSGG